MGGSIPRPEEENRSRIALNVALEHAKAGRKRPFVEWTKELRSRVLLENQTLVLTADEMVTLLDAFLPAHKSE